MLTLNQVQKCRYVLKQYTVFKHLCNNFTYKYVQTYICIYNLIFSSDTLEVSKLIYPTVSELSFYGCCRYIFFNECIMYSTTLLYLLCSHTVITFLYASPCSHNYFLQFQFSVITGN